MKKEIWVVVANSSYAKIYKAENNDKLTELCELKHPESRLHDRDLVSSKPGRTYASVGARRSSIEPHTSPKEQEVSAFAKQICHFLESAKEKEHLTRIYLTASPTFLGVLRQNLTPSISQMVSGQVDRDMTHLKAEEIRVHLPPVL